MTVIDLTFDDLGVWEFDGASGPALGLAAEISDDILIEVDAVEPWNITSLTAEAVPATDRLLSAIFGAVDAGLIEKPSGAVRIEIDPTLHVGRLALGRWVLADSYLSLAEDPRAHACWLVDSCVTALEFERVTGADVLDVHRYRSQLELLLEIASESRVVSLRDRIERRDRKRARDDQARKRELERESEVVALASPAPRDPAERRAAEFDRALENRLRLLMASDPDLAKLVGPIIDWIGNANLHEPSDFGSQFTLLNFSRVTGVHLGGNLGADNCTAARYEAAGNTTLDISLIPLAQQELFVRAITSTGELLGITKVRWRDDQRGKAHLLLPRPEGIIVELTDDPYCSVKAPLLRYAMLAAAAGRLAAGVERRRDDEIRPDWATVAMGWDLAGDAERSKHAMRRTKANAPNSQRQRGGANDTPPIAEPFLADYLASQT